jgi:phenylpropionate dioxygenase-like ring-hydroxylating dioxygenase large terminal subunit
MPRTATLQDLVNNHRPGWALDQQFYTDPDIYREELERILFGNWFMAGHVSQIPNNGDYLVARMDKESAIIVRGSDGEIRAFANVCRHRGSLICLEHSGSVRKFECPYHGWMYDIDGNLIAARSMNDEFDKKDYGLLPVSLEVFGDLLFVCFSDNPPSFDSARADLKEPMEMFGFDNMKLAAKRLYPIPANWKLAIENYMECYHCASAHPEYARMHTLMLEDSRRDRIQQKMLDRFETCGLRNVEIDCADESAPPGNCGYTYSRTALFEGYQTGSESGKAIAPLLGKLTGYDGGASDWSFGPFTYALAYSDHIVFYVFTPQNAVSSLCEIYWLVRGDAVEGTDYDVEELVWLWDITTESDKEIIVNNWKGVNSRYYKPGPFSKMERNESRYVEWIVSELSSDD